MINYFDMVDNIDLKILEVNYYYVYLDIEA